jgi:hypothetical protein
VYITQNNTGKVYVKTLLEKPFPVIAISLQSKNDIRRKVVFIKQIVPFPATFLKKVDP